MLWGVAVDYWWKTFDVRWMKRSQYLGSMVVVEVVASYWGG
jgi:hypothetical protein